MGLRSIGLTALALLGITSTLAAQYRLTAPSGTVLEFEPNELLSFRDRSDSLQADLDQDPEILYYTSFGPDLGEADARQAMPWNAMEVVTDSLAAVVMPGNLREADRAYVSYAVLRMHAVRQDPDVACGVLAEREIEAIDAFIDGWIVARTLFGGPAYEPLDELAFARDAGVLPGLIADRGDRQLSGCLAIWHDEVADAVEAYRSWRTDRYLSDG